MNKGEIEGLFDKDHNIKPIMPIINPELDKIRDKIYSLRIVKEKHEENISKNLDILTDLQFKQYIIKINTKLDVIGSMLDEAKYKELCNDYLEENEHYCKITSQINQISNIIDQDQSNIDDIDEKIEKLINAISCINKNKDKEK